MRTIEATLWPLEKPAPQWNFGVFLDGEHAPEMAGLIEGERVLVVEPNELQAEGIVHRVEVGGRWFWFAEIGDQDAIQVIYPSTSNAHR